MQVVNGEQDLRREGFSIPVDTTRQPYSDLEQGWEMTIFVNDQFINVIEGDFDRTIAGHSYHTWFKVTEERHLHQWQKAIQTCHQFSNDFWRPFVKWIGNKGT